MNIWDIRFGQQLGFAILGTEDQANLAVRRLRFLYPNLERATVNPRGGRTEEYVARIALLEPNSQRVLVRFADGTRIWLQQWLTGWAPELTEGMAVCHFSRTGEQFWYFRPKPIEAIMPWMKD